MGQCPRLSQVRSQKLNLFQKGLIIVTVPVVVGTAVALTMLWLVHCAATERARADHTKDILAHFNRMDRYYINTLSAASAFAMTGVQSFADKYDRCIAGCLNEFKALKVLLANEPKRLARLNALEKAYSRVVEVVGRAKEYIADHDRLSALTVIKEMRHDAQLIERDQAQFVEEISNDQASQPNLEGTYGQAIYVLLVASILANVLVAAVLAYYFSRNVTSRVSLIVDNSLRLARADVLHPRIGGKDEIANLDSVFHAMAQALTEAARKERAIIENTSDVICQLDESGRFQKANAAASQVFGWQPGELVGKSIGELVLADGGEAAMKRLQEIKEADRPGEFECKISRQDGSACDVLWAAQWSPTEQGFYCVVHDFTTRKELERMRREFMAMISHDLRTPLTSVDAGLTFLEEGLAGPLSADAQNIVASTHRNVEHLLGLVRDLLQLEKLEAGRLELELGETDLAAVISRSVEAVQALSEKVAVKIEQECAPVTITADGDRLAQVVINLLSNAIKFSPRGGTVRVGVRDEGDKVCLFVADEGRGIPDDLLTTIFEPFAQVERADETRRGGTGLGLPICKSIVELHGGTIGVESTTGQGSRFWVRLSKTGPSVSVIKLERMPEAEPVRET